MSDSAAHFETELWKQVDKLYEDLTFLAPEDRAMRRTKMFTALYIAYTEGCGAGAKRKISEERILEVLADVPRQQRERLREAQGTYPQEPDADAVGPAQREHDVAWALKLLDTMRKP